MTSTCEDFADGYDLSNEFFRLWLGERMSYTCAVFDEQHHDARRGAGQQGSHPGRLRRGHRRHAGARHRVRLGRHPRVPRPGAAREARARHHALARAARGGHGPQARGCRGVAGRLQGLRAAGEVRRAHLDRDGGPPRVAGAAAAGARGGRSTARTSTAWRGGPRRVRASASRRSCGTGFRGGARISKTSSSRLTSCFPEA